MAAVQISSFEKLLKSYLGFLEGTGKSASTIQSYRGDLLLLRDFFEKERFDFAKMSAGDFERYLYFMERMGLKTNTRRRKILTARGFYRYALSRKKLLSSPAQFLAPPKRLERLPWIPKKEEWERVLSLLPGKEDRLSFRNRLIVRLLEETGLSIAELCSLAWDQVSGRNLEVRGRKARRLRLSAALAAELLAYRKKSTGRYLFPGFNRYGITTAKMTPRGVELLFKDLAKRSGFKAFKPKTLRHYAVLRWLGEGLPNAEVLRRLGVRANYPLDAYRKLLKP